MKKSKKGGIQKYCKKHKIKMTELAKIVEISYSQLYLFDSNSFYPIRIVSAEQIYQKTKKKFEQGLHPRDYLDFRDRKSVV